MKFGCKVYTRLRVDGRWTYEERVLLVTAMSQEDAIRIAEESNRHYARETGGEWIDYVQCYEAKEYDDMSVSTEVYSLMRRSDMQPEEYLDVFEDTGLEHNTESDRSVIEGAFEISMEGFVEKGLQAFNPQQLLRIHMWRVHGLSYYEIAERIFPSDKLRRDTVVALSEGLKKALGSVKI